MTDRLVDLCTDCDSVRPLRVVTWSLLNLDPGIFYHSLAISAFCLSARYPSAEKDRLISEGLSYYVKGVTSVNNRLGDALMRQTDGIVVSIMGMAVHALTASTTHHGWCWEVAQPRSPKDGDNTDQFLLHFRALRTILNGRGGVETIAANRALRHLLYMYG